MYRPKRLDGDLGSRMCGSQASRETRVLRSDDCGVSREELRSRSNSQDARLAKPVESAATSAMQMQKRPNDFTSMRPLRRGSEDARHLGKKMLQTAPSNSVLGDVTVKAFVAIAMLMCANFVQVSHAGTLLRNGWNKSLVGKPCTTSSGNGW